MARADGVGWGVLATSCPSCGAPAPLCIAEPDAFRCAACGHAGAPPDDVRAQLVEAAAAIRRHAAGERQLHGFARAAVTRGELLQVLYGAFVLLLCSPFALIGVLALGNMLTGRGIAVSTAAFQLVAVAPVLLVLILTGAVALLWLYRLRSRVETSAAASPPDREGDPARCHVCGGLLTARGVRGVARCGYCEADNVIAPDAIRRASLVRGAVLVDHAAAVEAHAGTVASAWGCSTVASLALFLVTPVLCGVPSFFLAVSGWAVTSVVTILWALNGDPTPGNQYAWVDLPEGRCLAWYNPHEQAWQVEDSENRSDGRGVEPGPAVALDELMGRTLRSRFDPEVHGVAERAYWGFWMDGDGVTLDGSDSLALRTEKRALKRGPVWSLCEPAD